MAKGKFALGALFGIATGFAAGLLSAPKSGKETREELKEAAIKAKKTVVSEAEKAKASAAKKADEAKLKAEETVSEVKTKAEEVVEDVTDRAVDFKARAERAVEGAKQGFWSDSKNTKK